MTNNSFSTVEARIREQAAAYCESNNVPGFVAGVYHAGEQVVVAHGCANAATGAPMREDTGFLFGSVTKVLTTTPPATARQPSGAATVVRVPGVGCGVAGVGGTT
ncbi:serine hydrolase [Kitasatospora sp. NPDC057904]|uniref:serine hydrolase n=1 Tax=Kitasatospora sp. NPDC057904 TaxID=3346275 RepID=UPI0036DA32AF